MLRIMARENMEEWGTQASVEHETVRAVIEAYAEGWIDLPNPSLKTSNTKVRYAPSFSLDAPLPRMDHPYTAQMIAEFKGSRIPKLGGFALVNLPSGLTQLLLSQSPVAHIALLRHVAA